MPSVMYYDTKGNLKHVGYEALKDEVTEVAMTEGWVKLEWSVIDDSRRFSLPIHLSCYFQVETSPPPQTSLIRAHQRRRHPTPPQRQIRRPRADRFHRIPVSVRRDLHPGIVPEVYMAVGQGRDPVRLYASEWLGGCPAAADSACDRACGARPEYARRTCSRTFFDGRRSGSAFLHLGLVRVGATRSNETS